MGASDDDDDGEEEDGGAGDARQSLTLVQTVARCSGQQSIAQSAGGRAYS